MAVGDSVRMALLSGRQRKGVEVLQYCLVGNLPLAATLGNGRLTSFFQKYKSANSSSSSFFFFFFFFLITFFFSSKIVQQCINSLQVSIVPPSFNHQNLDVISRDLLLKPNLVVCSSVNFTQEGGVCCCCCCFCKVFDGSKIFFKLPFCFSPFPSFFPSFLSSILFFSSVLLSSIASFNVLPFLVLVFLSVFVLSFVLSSCRPLPMFHGSDFAIIHDRSRSDHKERLLEQSAPLSLTVTHRIILSGICSAHLPDLVY